MSEVIKAGKKAPAFKLPTPEGKMVSLSDFKGKYVVIDFWASWCPDCRKENPDLVKVHRQYAPKGVAFIGVSFDTERDAWLKGIESDSLNWTQVSSLVKWKETKISKDYGVNWIPTFYLINKKGRVIGAYITAEALSNALSKLSL
ncbi:MAG: TlpA family protein disulfide reductase [Bacteroidales bacterium]|nr:TlpA family protein disulfide reductase [Bacteroidales bacterium]MBO7479073.1 TlpA family protein disulfide reductase [Bacteroidales bacterium]MBO7487517.1 TlpA family protein disulfide reductase [Bacteroidales bacterium]